MTFTCSPTIEYRNVANTGGFVSAIGIRWRSRSFACAKTSLRDAIQTNEASAQDVCPHRLLSLSKASALHQKLIIRRGEKKRQCCGIQRRKFSLTTRSEASSRAANGYNSVIPIRC